MITNLLERVRNAIKLVGNVLPPPTEEQKNGRTKFSWIGIEAVLSVDVSEDSVSVVFHPDSGTVLINPVRPDDLYIVGRDENHLPSLIKVLSDVNYFLACKLRDFDGKGDGVRFTPARSKDLFRPDSVQCASSVPLQAGIIRNRTRFISCEPARLEPMLSVYDASYLTNFHKRLIRAGTRLESDVIKWRAEIIVSNESLSKIEKDRRAMALPDAPRLCQTARQLHTDLADELDLLERLVRTNDDTRAVLESIKETRGAHKETSTSLKFALDQDFAFEQETRAQKQKEKAGKSASTRTQSAEELKIIAIERAMEFKTLYLQDVKGNHPSLWAGKLVPVVNRTAETITKWIQPVKDSLKTLPN